MQESVDGPETIGYSEVEVRIEYDSTGQAMIVW